MPLDRRLRDRLRVSVAEYEYHRERAGEPDADLDAFWWYAAWGEALVPVLKAIITAENEDGHGR